MRKRPGLGLSLLLLALQLHAAGAWAPVGHDRIARIAEHLLEGKHKDQLRTMMHNDLPDFTRFEQNTVAAFPDTQALHFHRQDPEWTCGTTGGLGLVRCDGHGAEKGSLFCALAFFFEHFAHDALLKEFPEPKEPIGTPDSLPALKSVPAAMQTPANWLKSLVFLIGDMHQPLHWLHEHDYGRDIKVRYKNMEYTLLQFWEEYLPAHVKNKLETGVQPFMSDKDYGQHSKAWAHKVPTELFRDWAKESAERVCGDVYAPMTVNHADGTRIDTPFTLTDELHDKWVSLAEEMLQLAGERLGFILNEIIEHKRHKDAHKDGRGLPSRKVAVEVEKKVVEDAVVGAAAAKAAAKVQEAINKAVPDRQGNPTMTANKGTGTRPDIGLWYKQLKIEERRRSHSAAMWNGFIAIILAPSLLFAFSWHERNGGGNLLTLAKLKM